MNFTGSWGLHKASVSKLYSIIECKMPASLPSPPPFFALLFCQCPCTPTHAYATHTPATGWQRDLMWVLPSVREMIRVHTYWPFIILSQAPVHSSAQFKRRVLPLFPFYKWGNCSLKRWLSYQKEIHNQIITEHRHKPNSSWLPNWDSSPHLTLFNNQIGSRSMSLC